MPLDDLVGAPADRRPAGASQARAPQREDLHPAHPATRGPAGIQDHHGRREPAEPDPEPKTHEGYEWLYVLNGRLRLILGDQDLVLTPGEVAEFDTRLPHRLLPADETGVELLILFDRQGERVHVRARSGG